MTTNSKHRALIPGSRRLRIPHRQPVTGNVAQDIVRRAGVPESLNYRTNQQPHHVNGHVNPLPRRYGGPVLIRRK